MIERTRQVDAEGFVRSRVLVKRAKDGKIRAYPAVSRRKGDIPYDRNPTSHCSVRRESGLRGTVLAKYRLCDALDQELSKRGVIKETHPSMIPRISQSTSHLLSWLPQSSQVACHPILVDPLTKRNVPCTAIMGRKRLSMIGVLSNDEELMTKEGLHARQSSVRERMISTRSSLLALLVAGYSSGASLVSWRT
jgi:hypothetical protein